MRRPLHREFSDTEVTFTLGSYYFNNQLPGNVGLNPGDNFTVGLYGVIASGTVGYAALGGVSANYTCNVPGLGPTAFPFVISESPSPPATMVSGASFSTAMALQLTVPASIINDEISAGITQVTADSASADVNADPGSDMSPSSNDVAASNMPQSYVDEPNTPLHWG